MSERVPYFLRVLRAELSDLAEDIAHFEAGLRDRFERDEVTRYVYMENEALLVREQEACRALVEFVDGMEISLYKSIDEAARAVISGAEALVADRGEPQAIVALLRRKIAKVRRYIESGETR